VTLANKTVLHHECQFVLMFADRATSTMTTCLTTTMVRRRLQWEISRRQRRLLM